MTRADTGTDPGAPVAGGSGDATAGLASAELHATTSDHAVSAQPDQSELPDEPGQPAEAMQDTDAESAIEPASPAEPAPADEPPGTEERAPADPLPVSELAGILPALSALGGRMDDIASATAELSRLRSRDTDLIARLHEDVTRLRSGEIATAMNPVVTGMIKLHDQMVSLGALDDPASPVGMLRTQLLQIMELTCAVTPFTPAPGERFDASRHTGARRIPTTDASEDGTIASTIKAGFARADGSVVRVAEVEVHRLSG
ncbi:MAG TPA: nucleotide exchange factor GrpE [Streptosporangiaceae bacterium]